MTACLPTCELIIRIITEGTVLNGRRLTAVTMGTVNTLGDAPLSVITPSS